MEKRGNEEDYFHQRDLEELLERMRKARAAEQAHKDLGDRSGLRDPELLKDLEESGFTPDTLKLLPIVPVLHVAWARRVGQPGRAEADPRPGAQAPTSPKAAPQIVNSRSGSRTSRRSTSSRAAGASSWR